MLELKDISKEYKPKKGEPTIALKNINITFPKNGMVFITGKSGCGKSTLLNIIGGLDKESSGELILHKKSFLKFKSPDFDSYRNTYLGFIFQDFNLIEEYNVYKNIEIAFSLQKKKTQKETIDIVLDKVGISNLGNRKINELSGGQKQRVAIARAIAKDSSIILADEPTGNLDSENSIQIFNILKEISKEKLVIVVTHDIESANIYADRMIELHDGVIVKDENKIVQKEDQSEDKFKFNKTRLSFLKSIALAFSNIKRKKIRMLITTLLITFALTLFGFSYMITTFNIPYTHSKTIEITDETKIELYKKVNNKIYSNSSLINAYSEQDLATIKQKLSKYGIIPLKSIMLVENDMNPMIQFNDKYNEDGVYKDTLYYSLYMSDTYFTEFDNNENIKIIGELPKNKNEVLITKIQADYMIEKGIINIEYDKEKNQIDKVTKFSSYEDVISKNYTLEFGTNQFIITGIIDEDMSKYEILKDLTYDEYEINPNPIYDEFNEKYSNDWYIYVNKNFFDELVLMPNIQFNSTAYKFSVVKDDNQIFTQSPVKLTMGINIYNGTSTQKVTQLNDNEIVINDIFLSEYDSEFAEARTKYMEEENKKYREKEKEYQEKVNEQQKILEKNPDAEVKEIKEPQPFDYTKLYREYTYNYLKETNLIGSTINIRVNDLYLKRGSTKETDYKNVKIIGYLFDYVSEDGWNSYLSDNIMDNWLSNNINVSYLYFNESSAETLEQLFTEIPLNSKEYKIKTLYSDSMSEVQKVVNKVSNIAHYTTIAFLIFTVIIFMNFIISSINKSKKDIGILRALGTKKKDVFKIYVLESVIIGTISVILSFTIIVLLKNYCNTLISKDLFFTAEVLILRIEILYYLIISVITIILLSSLLPIYKFSNMKPIDAINNK
jgi:ABC-type antimicrobial peptide transport system, ATPase component